MPAAWPITATFPTAMRVGPRQTPNSNMIETQMSTGYPKRRRRDRVKYDTYSGSVILNESDKDVFLAWFHDTILDGSLEFEWKHPFTGATANFVLVNTPEPQWMAFGLYEIGLLIREVP